MKKQAAVAERKDLTCAACGGKLTYVPAWGNEYPLCKKCERSKSNV